MKLIDADAAMVHLNELASKVDDAGLRNVLYAIAVFLQYRPEVNLMERKTYTTEELYPNCTVQIWKTDSGDVSVGWWENQEPPMRSEENV